MNKRWTSCALAVLLQANVAYAIDVVPLGFMTHRECSGALYANERYIDLYTPFYDCHRMPYVKVEMHTMRVPEYVPGPALANQTARPLQGLAFYLQERTRSCPFEVIAVSLPYTGNDSDWYRVAGFHRAPQFKSFLKGHRPWVLSEDTLDCESYPGLFEDAQESRYMHVPEKRRAPVIPDRRTRLPQLPDGIRKNSIEKTR